MAIRCAICNKEFKRMEDVYTHPYSFVRPKFVHRECIPFKLRLIAAGGPHFTILTNLEMTVPLLCLFIIVFIYFISYMPISVLFFVFIALFLFLIFFRIHFMKFYLDAVNSFKPKDSK